MAILTHTELVFFHSGRDMSADTHYRNPGLKLNIVTTVENIPSEFYISDSVAGAWKERFEIAHKAVVAYLDGIPCHLSWLANSHLVIDELQHSWRIPQGDICIYDCRTLPEYRNRGIYTDVLSWIVKSDLLGTNDCNTYIYSDSRNKASITGIQQAGFREIGRKGRITLFGILLRQTSTVNI